MDEQRYFHFLGNPRWYIWGLVVLFIIFTCYVVLAVQYNFWPFHVLKIIQPNSSAPMDLVGGDRDEHGCIGSAGYQWCEEKQKCLRIWEEDCSSLPKY